MTDAPVAEAPVPADSWAATAATWRELMPMAARLARLDPFQLVRLRADAAFLRVLAWLPSGALVGNTVRRGPDASESTAADFVTQAGAMLRWLETGDEPQRVDGAWLTGIPPVSGWQRVDTVPGSVVRDLVDQGAQAHRDVVDQQLGSRAADTLLDTPVLLVASGGVRAEVTNRMLSAVTSMSFLPADGQVSVAVSGRWTRVAAAHGSVFAENRRGGLSLA